METLSHLPIHVSTWWTDLSIPPGWAASVIEWSLAHISPVEGVMVALTFFAWVGTVAYARQVRAVPRPQDMVARQIDEADKAREEASR